MKKLPSFFTLDFEELNQNTQSRTSQLHRICTLFSGFDLLIQHI